jgi:hypothetical protein
MAAGSTYTPIATNTLGSAAATVTFSSIPGTYTDLYLVANVSNATGDDNFLLNFNGDTGSNYSVTRLYGDGTSPSSSRATNQTIAQIGGFGNTLTMIRANIMNYSNTTTYKTVLTRNDRAANFAGATVDLWRSTAAITTILISTSSYNFSAGSTFTLYGISAA